MIFLDSSVVLAALLAEPRQPSMDLWGQQLIASRLVELEAWTRIFAYGLPARVQADTRELLAKIDLIEIEPHIVERMYAPFPVTLRTLDAIHIATAYHLTRNDVQIRLASFDERMNRAAAALGIPLYDLQ